MGDLSSRRGMVQGMDDIPGGGKVIKAEVPLSEMFGYSNDLRSMTQGKGGFSMEFLKYQKVPTKMQEEIVKKVQADNAKKWPSANSSFLLKWSEARLTE